jgi:hypothetical protein
LRNQPAVRPERVGEGSAASRNAENPAAARRKNWAFARNSANVRARFFEKLAMIVECGHILFRMRRFVAQKVFREFSKKIAIHLCLRSR